jgi:hypothetical protein
MSDPSLIDLKKAFTENQLPELQGELAAFIFNHPIFGSLPAYDQRAAAYDAAVHLLLAIRSESIVGLVR